MKTQYPDDGGLKEPVREFGEGFNGFDMIREHFGVRRSEPDPLSRGHGFNITHIPGLYYHAHNVKLGCGHYRLFGKPGRGWMIHSYGRQVPGNEEWAEHRRWNFVLFCVHHVEPGKKATDLPGWAITWASLKFKKFCGGFSITWQPADTYRARKL